MVPTYFDIGLRGSAESWRALRRRRAAQPVPAGDTDPDGDDVRAETFRSSLEQAEQQFAAAAVVGYDSRALNLFYGLSQAERAIAAVAPGGQWELRGHGIKAPDLNVAEVLGLRLEPWREGGSGNFVRVSELLSSDALVAFTLGEVWPLLVETVLHERPESPTPAPLFVRVDSETVTNDGASVVTGSLQLYGACYPPGGRW